MAFQVSILYWFGTISMFWCSKSMIETLWLFFNNIPSSQSHVLTVPSSLCKNISLNGFWLCILLSCCQSKWFECQQKLVVAGFLHFFRVLCAWLFTDIVLVVCSLMRVHDSSLISYRLYAQWLEYNVGLVGFLLRQRVAIWSTWARMYFLIPDMSGWCSSFPVSGYDMGVGQAWNF